jgi:CRP-like cAMP-binding protein
MPHIDLLELPYFEGISLDDVAALVDRMDPCYFPAGSVIVQEGDTASAPLYIVTAGRISMSKKGPDGADHPLAEPSCPTLFGEIELLCQLPVVATVRAVTAVSAFTLSRATFEALMAPPHHVPLLLFVSNVARVTCHRLAIADELLVSVLHGEDLVKMRSNLFAKQGPESSWTRTTGVFKLPPR